MLRQKRTPPRQPAPNSAAPQYSEVYQMIQAPLLLMDPHRGYQEGSPASEPRPA
jgi:hypothetical protein